MRRYVFGFALFAVLLIAHVAAGEENKLYKYVDEKGVTHFTDDVASIPQKHQQEMESFDAVKPSSTPSTPPTRSTSPTPKTVTPKQTIEDLEARQKRQLYLQEKQRLDQLGQDLIEQNARLSEDLRWAKKRRRKSGQRKHHYKQLLKEQKAMEQKIKEYQEAMEDFDTEDYDELE